MYCLDSQRPSNRGTIFVATCYAKMLHITRCVASCGNIDKFSFVKYADGTSNMRGDTCSNTLLCNKLQEIVACISLP